MIYVVCYCCQYSVFCLFVFFFVVKANSRGYISYLTSLILQLISISPKARLKINAYNKKKIANYLLKRALIIMLLNRLISVFFFIFSMNVNVLLYANKTISICHSI